MSEALRVLYIGDGAESAEGVPPALERADSELAVEGVADTDAALERAADGFDCVVARESPGVDGIQFLASVREQFPALPVVLASDIGGDGPTGAAVAAGVASEQTDTDALLAERIRTAVDAKPAGLTPRRDSVRLHSETFPDIAFYIDEEGRYVDVVADRESPLLYDDPDALVGEHLADVLPADTAERIEIAIQRTLDTGEVQTIQYQLDVQAGTRWFEARFAPAETHTDRRQVLLIARDITDQKEREQALEALHEMATTIQTAETVKRACELTVTAAADILDFEMCSVTIQEGDYLVPYAISESAPPDGARTMHVEEGLAGKTFQTGESYTVDQVRSGDDTSPTFDAIESGLSTPIGDYGVFQAVSTEPDAFDEEDITLAELLVSHTRTAIERIEREEALTRKTERLEEFASFVSHDLRNPLNVATLRLELLDEDCESEHVEGLGNALDRMERLIDELLTLARQGETIGETEPVVLSDVVNRAWNNVETNGATLVCETDRTLYADHNRLTAVLENLVRNAVEHGSTTTRTESDDAAEGDSAGTRSESDDAVEHGEGVTVTVGDLPDGTGFYIADDGAGIPESKREDVFESGYSTAEDGTGFGLTIVRDIVEAHDWEIRITDSEGGGARFEITGVEFAG
jgi:PAS domain S-box-containing protein